MALAAPAHGSRRVERHGLSMGCGRKQQAGNQKQRFHMQGELIKGKTGCSKEKQPVRAFYEV